MKTQLLLQFILVLLVSNLNAQVQKEMELTPEGIILPKLDKMAKATMTASKGQMLFNTTNNTVAFHDGLDWQELSTRSDNQEITNIQQPYVSSQGDRLYLGDGSYVIIPGISAAQLATITDVDGNVYGTFCFTFGVAGTQYCWMTENLRTTKYRDGTAIADGNGVANINIAPNAEYMFDFNNNPGFTPSFGKLYTHQVAINSKEVCPNNYDVPTKQHWLDLVSWLAGNTPAWGGKEAVALKAQHANWQTVSGGQAVDYYGFNILASGYRSATFYGGTNIAAKFWTHTTGSTNNANRAWLKDSSNTIDINEEHVNQGFSIRCVKVTP